MTPDDFAQAALDLDLHRRAGAMCAAAEPHRDADEDWPCSRHLLDAARQLAISAHLSALASMSSGMAAQPRAEGIDGAAGCVPSPPLGPAAAPPPNSSPPRASHAQGGGTGPQGA